MPARSGSPALPVLPGLDHTRAFLREGYDFVGNRCEELGSDGFRARIMLRPVTCFRGTEAARLFYEPGRMTRKGAMPMTTVALLQGTPSVQALDGPAHEVRKALFLGLMTEARLREGREIFAEEFASAATGWAGRTIELRAEAQRIMTRTALRWCGLDAEAEDLRARTRELTAMIERSGSIGPGYLRARLLRSRCERWARARIREAREAGTDTGTLGALLAHRDADGGALDTETASVELINLLRPIVAIARYVVFAAHALATQDGLPRPGTEAQAARWAQEVRRLYPFFPVIGGRVRNPFSWRGHAFAEDDWILLDLHGTNHHPQDWLEAARFDPDRHAGPVSAQPEALVPQGAGSFERGHRCPGEWLTMEILTEAVLRLSALDAGLPQQDLTIPHGEMPPWPGSGLRLSVAG